MPRNKNRVYLALYERTDEGGHHHMALVLAPKAASAAPNAHQSWRFRAARGVDQRWTFVAESVRNRSGKAGALVLLGKCTHTGEQLREMLVGLSTAQVDSCTGWTTEAIQVLIDKDVIEVPLADLKRLHRKAGALADSFFKLSPEQRVMTSIPTINNSSERIESEIKGIAQGINLSDTASEISVWC